MITDKFLDIMQYRAMSEEEYQFRYEQIMNETTDPVDRIFLRRLYELHCEIRDDEVIKEARTTIRRLAE